MNHSANPARRATGALLLILCVAALCALPWLLPAGQLVAAVQMLIAALFACAFILLAGQGGMLSVGRLRTKLRDAGAQIETVIGLGYRFVD